MNPSEEQMSKALDRIRRIVGLMLLRDAKAADEMELMGDELYELATKYRESLSAREHPMGDVSVGGAVDRVQMKLIGPDGQVKSHHDTGART